MVVFLCERADDKKDPRRALAETCEEPEIQALQNAFTSLDIGP